MQSVAVASQLLGRVFGGATSLAVGVLLAMHGAILLAYNASAEGFAFAALALVAALAILVMHVQGLPPSPMLRAAIAVGLFVVYLGVSYLV